MYRKVFISETPFNIVTFESVDMFTLNGIEWNLKFENYLGVLTSIFLRF